MKKKNKIAAVLAAACVCALIFGAAVFVIRPDLRLYCGQRIKYGFGRFPLEEVSLDEDSLETVNVGSLVVGESLMLVNKAHPLAEGYAPQLCEYKDSGVEMSVQSVGSYGELSADVMENTGCGLYVMSSYRDAEEQEEILGEQGSSTAMPPECSEHRTGLAQDLYFTGFSGTAINKCKAGRYLTEHAAEHGFILRYPPAEMSVTGIEYEPWHFRYVGSPHAEIITDSGITLEEYIRGLEYGKFYEYGDYVISRQQGEELIIPKDSSWSVSIDNCGGYVVTAYRG